MIPKIIWQTYKTEYPPEASRESIKTWLTLNPEYEWCYMDDAACEQFIRDNYSDEFYKMYMSLPYGVMKSDAWRVAVVYAYGGVYADLDTICIHPIDSWTTDRDLVVSYEPPTQHGIVNFCFAAEAKHPALLRCLEHLLINYNGPNYLDRTTVTGTPVQNFGQAAFASGIKDYFSAGLDTSASKLYSIEENAFTPFPDHRSIVYHQTGSVHWGQYDSWRQQQKHDFGY